MTKSFLKLLSEQIRQQPQKRRTRTQLFGETREASTQEIPADQDWSLHQGRLQKSYSFDSSNKLQAFVSEILEYETKTKHLGNMQIGDSTVIIEVFTKGINSVTELDYEYAREADLIYKDVEYY